MPRSHTAVWAYSGWLLAMAACRTIPASSDAPAAITHPTSKSRAALAKAVTHALNGATVTLADDALTQTDTLTIEHAHPRDHRGLPMDGRERGFPERFQLVKSGKECSLIHSRTKQRYVLAGVTCSAL